MDQIPANENRYMEDGLHDPDRHYVGDYLKSALAHFAERDIYTPTVFKALSDALATLLAGNPYRSPVDAWAMESDLALLYPLQDRVNFLVRQYEMALARAAKERAEAGQGDAG